MCLAEGSMVPTPSTPNWNALDVQGFHLAIHERNWMKVLGFCMALSFPLIHMLYTMIDC